MKLRLMKLALAATAALALAGCPSVSTMATARTAPEGEFQYYVAPGFGSLGKFAIDDEGKAEGAKLPGLELGARYGVSDRVEVGGKLFPVGFEAGARVQVLRAPTLERGLDLAVAPSLSVYPWSKGAFGWAHLSVPVGFNVGGGNQLVLAPRVSGLLVTSEEGTGKVFYAGGTVGVAIPIGDGWLRIVPEVGALVPMSRNLPTDVEAKFALRGNVYQGGVGLLFGP